MKATLRILRLPVSTMLAFLLLSASWVKATECYILSAGVDNYPHVGKLNGCINDARNTTAAFTAQAGKLFTNVHAHTLVDGQATHALVLRKMQDLAHVGRAGDYVVIFLSGHGGRTPDQRNWFFLPYDYNARSHAATALTDRQILDATHVLVQRGKKVIIIVDACHSGQLNASARPYLQKYTNPQAGGLIVMASSGAAQTSAALGQYSAYAKAFADAMGAGDLNRDGTITLDEVRRYAHDRTHQLVRERNIQLQDSEVAWSASISPNLAFAVTKQPQQAQARTWAGNETLPGYGALSFQFFAGGRVLMHDAKGRTQGTWQQNGNQVTLRFPNGRSGVVYSGTLQGGAISGTAHNERQSWNWHVHVQ